MSEHFGPRRQLRPELLFKALHRQAVDYVAIGGLAAVAHGRASSTDDIDLTIARTIENCTALGAALVGLDACLSPGDRKALDSRRAPTRMLDREYILDTAAGGVDLRLPRFVPGCPPYPELRAESVRCPLGNGLEIRVAGLDHLTEMRHAFRFDLVLDDPEPELAISESEPANPLLAIGSPSSI